MREKIYYYEQERCIENKKIEHGPEGEEEGEEEHKERKTKVCCTSMRISSYLSFHPLPPKKTNKKELNRLNMLRI